MASGMGGLFQAGSPLHVKMSPKGFVQLTLWAGMLIGAFLAARWGIAKLQMTAKKATGAVSGQTGSTNPFFA